jgi:23S rRNA (adenine2503-C2)-methyltransferase
MADSRLDVTGLTFEDAAGALGTSPGRLRGLRAQYGRLMRGESESEPDLCLVTLPIASRIDHDGVTKFAFRTHDGLEVESVAVPMQHAQRHWRSVCVSCQVGCRRGCRFCETAALGLIRDLTAAEMVAQVLTARREFGREIRTVVFMGMGEPLDNFEAVVQAVRVLNDRAGLSVSMERITLSTAGVLDGIARLGALGWKRINLAVSLNAPNDAIRMQLMPIARTESMASLREALLAYPRRPNQHFMLEYVLIPGENDAPEHAREVAAYLRGIKCMLNVIGHNPRRGALWRAASDAEVQSFVDQVQAAGQPARRRVTRGRDAMAACGQLGNRQLARGAHPAGSG